MVVELEAELEKRVKNAAERQAVTPSIYVSKALEAYMPPEQALTYSAEERQAAAEALRSFAKDRGIQLPAGVTVKSLIEEGRM